MGFLPFIPYHGLNVCFFFEGVLPEFVTCSTTYPSLFANGDCKYSPCLCRLVQCSIDFQFVYPAIHQNPVQNVPCPVFPGMGSRLTVNLYWIKGYGRWADDTTVTIRWTDPTSCTLVFFLAVVSSEDDLEKHLGASTWTVMTIQASTGNPLSQ